MDIKKLSANGNLIKLGETVANYRHNGYSVHDTLKILKISKNKYYQSYKAAGYKLEGGKRNLINRYGEILIPTPHQIFPNDKIESLIRNKEEIRIEGDDYETEKIEEMKEKIKQFINERKK